MSETTTPKTDDLPEALAEIVTDFAETPSDDRLQVLLEFATDLPDLPEKYTDHPELLEPVPECQSPIFLVTEVTDAEAVLSVPADLPLRLSMSEIVSPLRLRGMSGMLSRIQRQVSERIGKITAE